MENMTNNKNLIVDHKLVLTLIDRVKSAKTFHNIEQTLRALGVYIEDLISVIRDLSGNNLITIQNFKDSPSIYKATETGVNLLAFNENNFKSEVLSVVRNKELFLKICW